MESIVLLQKTNQPGSKRKSSKVDLIFNLNIAHRLGVSEHCQGSFSCRVAAPR